MCDVVPDSRNTSVLLQGECKFPATNLHFHRIKWFLKFCPKKQLKLNNFSPSSVNPLGAEDDAGFSIAMNVSVTEQEEK